jgi:hypothetical protein
VKSREIEWEVIPKYAPVLTAVPLSQCHSEMLFTYDRLQNADDPAPESTVSDADKSLGG